MDTIIGTPISRAGCYVIEKFLSNQKQIQNNYPSSELILATSAYDFVGELEGLLNSFSLNGSVLFFSVVRPEYARNNIWGITCAREAIRKHTLSQTDARYLLFLDADMIFEPPVITVMKEAIQGYDVVFSGYPLRDHGIGLAGAGCVMLTRNILEKIMFRCYEFKNGEVIFEDNLLEMDLFRLHARIKKGFFVSIGHYKSESEVKYISPQRVGILRKIANLPLLRYWLIRISTIARYNIPWKLKVLFNKSPQSVKNQSHSDQI